MSSLCLPGRPSALGSVSERLGAGVWGASACPYLGTRAGGEPQEGASVRVLQMGRTDRLTVKGATASGRDSLAGLVFRGRKEAGSWEEVLHLPRIYTAEFRFPRAQRGREPECFLPRKGTQAGDSALQDPHPATGPCSHTWAWPWEEPTLQLPPHLALPCASPGPGVHLSSRELLTPPFPSPTTKTGLLSAEPCASCPAQPH